MNAGRVTRRVSKIKIPDPSFLGAALRAGIAFLGAAFLTGATLRTGAAFFTVRLGTAACCRAACGVQVYE